MKESQRQLESVEDVLDCVEEAGDGDSDVTLGDIIGRIGDNAFAPLMLLPALVMISPASAIFGVATICGAIIALVALQMVVGRDRLWLPDFILSRKISTSRLDTVTDWLDKPARLIDRLTTRRLSWLLAPPADRAWAAICLALAIMAPLFELVPMSATVIATAISLFALALLVRDGLLALLGLVALGGAFWLVWTVAT